MIFGRKKEEVLEGWGRLHYEELHDLYSTQNIIGVIKEYVRGEACTVQGGNEKCIQHLVGEPETEEPILKLNI